MRPDVETDPGSTPLEMGDKGLTQILAHVIAEVRGSVNKDINGAELLYSLLNAPWLQSLLKVYESLQRHLKGPARPYLSYSSGLSLQILSDLLAVPKPSNEARELYALLSHPHLQALLSAHDTVSLRDYEPDLPPLPKDLPEDEEAMRIVCLVKNNQPLGATIRRDDVTGEIYIARVIHGGLANRSGLLHAGDRLVEVNGQPVFGLEPEQIIQILTHSHGTIMFKVVPITDRPVNNQNMLYVRAMVDYNPHVDPSIPCADAGMAFRKGDILEIVDRSDTLWWQAVKLPSITACAGLIPSTSLLKRKQKELWWSQPYHPYTCVKTLSTVDEGEHSVESLEIHKPAEDDLIAIDEKCVKADEEAFESELKDEESEFSTNIEGIYLTGFRRSLRLCRQRRGQDFGTSQFCTLFCPTSCYSLLANPYEEVVRYQHHPEHPHRLIALLGPSGVGVNELRRRLIEINPKVYQGAVPHTTRPPKCHEGSGREYHFISREQFDSMVCNLRFIEFGELRGHLYGTSVDAVKDVLASGKICVIDIEPYALESVRTAELRAYVIFIKPPTVEQMKCTRMNSHIITNCYTSRPFKDEDFQEIEDAGRNMEQHYCQFFDHVIVNDGLQAACVQLLTAVRRAQDEPQWVPTAWIRPTGQS
ncbi:MAGUK p55 subfamily member 4 isoform X2 [Sinocyclocheilus anshuiensis]|uniref:MAGUK p55 subfamily member 4 isoform X2 n=1 Tax=Sinocyclocheilus anshuiensis TaxID=1608454 RepID=UPI0007B86BF9|nr:PREDICTED: MAGUK p55 subfamily member 4-like isoform X2 [Sinocyclocheilus anshuiensis]